MVGETNRGNTTDWYPELLAPTPAEGGEPCRICEHSIPRRAHPVQKKRQVCSPACNQKLKRRLKYRLPKDKEIQGAKKQKIRSSEFPNPRTSEPRYMGTLPGSFPYEFDRYPIAGDIIERHGHQTFYLDFLDTMIPSVIRECFAPWLRDLQISDQATLFTWHPQSNAIGVTFKDSSSGIPKRLSFPKLLIDGMFIHHPHHAAISGTGTALDGIYRGREFISDLDEDGVEYRWEAEVFSPVMPEALWTPSRAALSMARRRATDARNSYLARTRAMDQGATNVAHNVDPNQIFERDQWTCKICGQSVDPTFRWPDPKSASLDHRVPVTRGGQHVAKNLETSHLICNIRKNNKPSEDSMGIDFMDTQKTSRSY